MSEDGTEYHVKRIVAAEGQPQEPVSPPNRGLKTAKTKRYGGILRGVVDVSGESHPAAAAPQGWRQLCSGRDRAGNRASGRCRGHRPEDGPRAAGGVVHGSQTAGRNAQVEGGIWKLLSAFLSRSWAGALSVSAVVLRLSVA